MTSKQSIVFTPISLDNQLSPVSLFVTNDRDCPFYQYVQWIDKQINPAKSYRDHPIESESQLITFKKLFEQYVGISLGAYLRIKRAYYLLNQPSNDNLIKENLSVCQYTYITTPIGLMLAIFADEKLCLLEFLERKMLETELKQVLASKKCQFVFKTTTAAQLLQSQLDEYFAGKRQSFNVALDFVGTEFQRDVWQTLQGIDYGMTVSYQDEAEQMGKPTAMRAVANANGKNKISIVIPCHRVIRKSGDLGGYGGGLWRKQYLLALENTNK